MVQTIINALVPVIVTAIVGVLVASVKAIGDALVAFIGKQKEAVAVKVGIDTYNSKLTLSRGIWNLVDEEFRITPTLEKTIEAKQKMFETEILKVIPGITVDEITQLRQVVAGEINKGKDVVVAPATPVPTPVETPTTPVTPAQ